MQLTVRSWRFPDLSSRSIAVCFEAAVALHELAEMGAVLLVWSAPRSGKEPPVRLHYGPFRKSQRVFYVNAEVAAGRARPQARGHSNAFHEGHGSGAHPRTRRAVR